MTEYKKPLPEITAESRPFWEGCRSHRLLIQRCRGCGNVQHYPRAVCATCWSEELTWQKSPGRGSVYTFTVVHRTEARGFREEVPYVIAYVELEEGVQLLTNLVGSDPARLSIGMPVEVTFEDVDDQITIPRFKPTS